MADQSRELRFCNQAYCCSSSGRDSNSNSSGKSRSHAVHKGVLVVILVALVFSQLVGFSDLSCRGGASPLCGRTASSVGYTHLHCVHPLPPQPMLLRAEEKNQDGRRFSGSDGPYVGRRLRVWFLNSDDNDTYDYEYGSIVALHGHEGDQHEVTIEWDTGLDPERTRLSELGRVEWLGDDAAADIVANLKEHRAESLDGSEEANAESVVLSPEHLQKEIEAIRWLRQEVAAREAEAESLRRENEEFRAQRKEFLGRYGDMFDDSDDDGDDDDDYDDVAQPSQGKTGISGLDH